MYPPGTDENTAQAQYGVGWASQIYPYVKSAGVYMCPDDSTSTQCISYAYNINISIGSNYPAYTPMALAKFNAPAKTVLLVEVANDNNQGDPMNFSVQETLSTAGGYFSPATDGTKLYDTGNQFETAYMETGYMAGRGNCGMTTFTTSWNNLTGWMNPTGRHTDGSNVLLADGHVKWLRGDAISTGPNAAYMAFWLFYPKQNMYQDEANIDNPYSTPQGPTTNAAGTGGMFDVAGTKPVTATFSVY